MTDPLPLLLAGHLIGDWMVQTDWQAANKTRPAFQVSYRHRPRHDEQYRRYERSYRTSWRAMGSHLLGYHATLAVCVGPAWHGWGLAVLLAVSVITHGFIDRRWPVRALLTHTGSGWFAEQMWGVMVVDQALHLSILMLTLAILRS